MKLPPWHLWGVDANVNFATLAGGNQSTQQLARIDYKRPESFRFFVYLTTTKSDQAGANWQLTAEFQLIIGVGRSQVIVPDWIVLSTGTQPTGALPQLFSAASPTKGVIAGLGGAALQGFSEIVVAQQLNCSCVVTANATANIIGCQVGAYFAPNMHMRPDWLKQDPSFDGEEIAGH